MLKKKAEVDWIFSYLQLLKIRSKAADIQLTGTGIAGVLRSRRVENKEIEFRNVWKQ